MAAKQASLLLHKSGGRNNRGYCSPYSWPQNRRAYCYTNKVVTSVVTVPKILGRKTSGLIVTQIRWQQQSWLLFPIFLPQNKRAYCYTNQVATTIVVTGPHILGRKTSELIVTKIVATPDRRIVIQLRDRKTSWPIVTRIT